MNASEKRELVASQMVKLAFLRQHPELTNGALDMLAVAAAATPAFRSHVATGEVLALHEVLDGVRLSDAGQLIFAEDDANDAANADADAEFLRSISTLSPAQRMAAARARGWKH